MKPSMNMLILQLILLLYIRKAVSQGLTDNQRQACSFNIRDEDGVECAAIDPLLDDRFFDALRTVESQGNLCSKEEDKIGPYHISEEYYNEAVCFDEELRLNGSVWKHVWGDFSDEYSRKVIRSYICYHGTIMKRRRGERLGQFSINSVAAIHKRGSQPSVRVPDFIEDVRTVYYSDEEIPDAVPEECETPCRVGECCMLDACWCMNATSIEASECQVCRTLQVGGLDMVFVLDASGSIGSTNFESMKQTLEDIVSELSIGPDTTRVAVVVFSSSANLIFNLNRYTDKETLIEAIGDIQYTGGGTNTAAALALLRTNVFSEILGVRPVNESTRVAIVITDGHSNDADATRQEAELLRSSAEFTIYAIGIGGGVGIEELISIAGNNNTVIQVENFRVEQLQMLERQITREACRSTRPGQLSEESEPVMAEVGQAMVAYYQVRIPEGGLTFMFDLEEGRVLICGSRTNQNPDCRDPSTYEWHCDTTDYCDFHVESSTSRKRRQAGDEFMFIGIEGVEENNEISVEVVTGDETVSNALAPMTLTDTVIILNDPLYEVPVTHTPPGMDPTTTSLCYQVHGESGKYYNLVSDDCIQVNVLYDAMENSGSGNLIKEIGILAQDTKSSCTEIRIKAGRCVPIIDGVAFNESYNENGIGIFKSRKRSYQITVPNCKASQGDDISFEIKCVKIEDQKSIHFDVNRGSGLKPGAHGLIGQFWSIPVDVLEYTGNYSGSVNNTYVVTVDHPGVNSTSRAFIAELHSSTWDRKRKQCLYVGSAQSGAIDVVDGPNDHVIEGTYDNYEVSGLFDSDFQYNQFQKDQCA